MQALFHEFDFTLRRRYALLRLLLERVQNVDRFFQFDRVDGAEGVAAMIGDNFQNSAREALQRLGIRVLVADLRLIKGKPNVPLHRIGEFGQNAVRVANEDQAPDRARLLIKNMPDLA